MRAGKGRGRTTSPAGRVDRTERFSRGAGVENVTSTPRVRSNAHGAWHRIYGASESRRETAGSFCRNHCAGRDSNKTPAAPRRICPATKVDCCRQDAVAVQDSRQMALRTAPLLKRKSAALNASSSRINSTGVEGLARLPVRRHGPEARLFPTAPKPQDSTNRGGEIKGDGTTTTLPA